MPRPEQPIGSGPRPAAAILEAGKSGGASFKASASLPHLR